MRLLTKHGSSVLDFSANFSIDDANPDNTSFANSFPAMMATMPNLQRLHVCGLSSSIMPGVSLYPLQDLTALMSLRSMFNAGMASINLALGPLAHLASLQTLNIHVQASGDAPVMVQGNLSMLCNLTKLFITSDSTAVTNDFVTTMVATIPALKVLHLAGVLHTLPKFAFTTSLQALAVRDLRYNDKYNAKLAGQLVPAQDLTMLSTILFDRFTGMMRPFWRGLWSSLEILPALRTLTVTESDLSALCWDDWALNPNLRWPALQYCQMSYIPAALTVLTALSALSLQGNRLKEIAPGPYLEQLTALDVSFNQFGIPQSALAHCRSLWLLLCDWKVDDPGSWDGRTLRCMLPEGCTLFMNHNQEDPSFDEICEECLLDRF